MAVRAASREVGPTEAIRIGELARRTGLTVRTIRYYEELGLLESVKRVENGARVYTHDDERRLRFIQRLKVLGLTLQEMLEVEKLYRKERTNRAVLPKLVEMLDRHLAQTSERVAALESLRDQIMRERERIAARLEKEAAGPGKALPPGRSSVEEEATSARS